MLMMVLLRVRKMKQKQQLVLMNQKIVEALAAASTCQRLGWHSSSQSLRLIAGHKKMVLVMHGKPKMTAKHTLETLK